MQATNMNSMKITTKRRIEAVEIYGVNLFKGENNKVDLSMLREIQCPFNKGYPICISYGAPNFRKKEVTLSLLLYESLNQYKLMLILTFESKQKLTKVRAQSIEDMLAHCNWLLVPENQHSIFYDSKLVSRSYFIDRGRTTNWDYIVSFGLIAEDGILQQSHLLLFSLAMTNLLTGKIQPFPSVVLLIGFSQNLTPLSYPRAFQSSKPPSCIFTYLPPGVEQKLTMSYLKQSLVSSFINLNITFLSS